MDLATIAEAIEVAASDMTGIPRASIAWVNTFGSNEWSTYPTVELTSKGPRRARAWDWTEKAYDADTDKLVKTQAGPREMVVSFRVETTDQTPGKDASQIISDIQTRLQRRSVLEKLRAAGVSLATISDPIGGDYPMDDRMNSAMMVDVLFNLAESDVDDSDNGDWFNIVKIRSNKLTNPDGTDAATQVDLTVGPP